MANNITDKTKKKLILLSCSRVATYDYLKNLLQHTSPNDKFHDELVKILSDYFNSKPSTTVQSLKSILTLESPENLSQVMLLPQNH